MKSVHQSNYFVYFVNISIPKYLLTNCVMNFVLWSSFLYFSTISRSNAEIYKSIQACIFNSAATFQVSSLIECALQSNLNGYRGFEFDNFLCSLYGNTEICQSDTPCPKKSIFVNEKVRTV